MRDERARLPTRARDETQSPAGTPYSQRQGGAPTEKNIGTDFEAHTLLKPLQFFQKCVLAGTDSNAQECLLDSTCSKTHQWIDD